MNTCIGACKWTHAQPLSLSTTCFWGPVSMKDSQTECRAKSRHGLYIFALDKDLCNCIFGRKSSHAQAPHPLKGLPVASCKPGQDPTNCSQACFEHGGCLNSDCLASEHMVMHTFYVECAYYMIRKDRVQAWSSLLEGLGKTLGDYPRSKNQ